MKTLLLITGESFRLGPQMSRGRGGEGSIQRQILASKSHLNIISTLKTNYSIDTDICLTTYKLNNECDNLLLDMYKQYIKYNVFYDTIFPSEELFNESVISYITSTIDLNQYSHIIIIRIDLFLKDYFFSKLYLSDTKVLFAHIDSNISYTKFSSVCHFISVFPNIYFKYLNTWKPHVVANTLAISIGSENIDLLIYSPHLISTDLEWNPLYIQVGRNNSLAFHNKDKKYNISTNTVENIPTYTDEYDTLINKDKLDELLNSITY
jgi:hypothetical protein